MESKQAYQVDNVVFERSGRQMSGALVIRTHHLIFKYPKSRSRSKPQTKEKIAQKDKRPVPHEEIWITYPMILHCVFKPNITRPAHFKSLIHLRCRDFTFITLYFRTEQDAKDVYDTIKQLSCNLGHIEKLYAFSYAPPLIEKQFDGWGIYNFHKEMDRLGVHKDGRWRISLLNKDYKLIETYPEHIVVPSKIENKELKESYKHRSRGRLPALTYLHPNGCSLTRCAQPMVGSIRGDGKNEDIGLVAAIFATTAQTDPQSLTPNLEEIPDQGGGNPEGTDDDKLKPEVSSEKFQLPIPRKRSSLPKVDFPGQDRANLIADARPLWNVLANHAFGGGSENMENYPGAIKSYLGIDNIHAMRKSLLALFEVLRVADCTREPTNKAHLQQTSWLSHIAALIKGVDSMARTIGLQQAHVVVHCSDGWDRTSQLCALAQLCLDPYYRTLEGFMVLVEKDWVSFGHHFRTRSGLMGDEKRFEIDYHTNSPNGAPNPIDYALNKMKRFLNTKNYSNKETSEEEYVDVVDTISDWWQDKPNGPKPNEISPIFHQFLDATYQLMQQHPKRFEFSERFLRHLFHHTYSCQYGTFLFDSEKERRDSDAKNKSQSVWNYFLARKTKFLNEEYDASLNETTGGLGPMIFYNTEKPLRWWSQLFGRPDHEMNDPILPPIPAAPTEQAEPMKPIELIGVVIAADQLASNPSASRSSNPPPESITDGFPSIPTTRLQGPILNGEGDAALGPEVKGPEPKAAKSIAATDLPTESAGAVDVVNPLESSRDRELFKNIVLRSMDKMSFDNPDESQLKGMVAEDPGTEEAARAMEVVSGSAKDTEGEVGTQYSQQKETNSSKDALEEVSRL